MPKIKTMPKNYIETIFISFGLFAKVFEFDAKVLYLCWIKQGLRMEVWGGGGGLVWR